MKKILFLEYVVNYGGAKIATINLAYQLPRYAPEYQTLIVDVNGSCKPFVGACKNHNIPLLIANEGGRPVLLKTKGAIRTAINRVEYIAEYLRTRKQVHRIIDEQKPDFVFVNTERALSFLVGYKGLNCTKVVFMAHFWYLNKQITWSNRFLFKKLVNKYICVSEATRQALYNNEVAPLEDIYVAHNSIDESTTHIEPAVIPNAEGCFKILHCGGFTEGKGQHVSLEIARQLKLHGLKFKMVFTGIIYEGGASQRYYERLEKMTNEYNLRDEVLFVVGHSNVYDYMQATDILIHPSTTEGFPLVIMEAQIMHKPVIANGVGGIIDLIHDGYTGFIANYNDVDDYVDCIMRLQNPVTYQFISENAYDFASHSLTVENQINSLIKVLKKNE